MDLKLAGRLKMAPAVFLLMFVVCLAVYFPSLKGGFLLDDSVLIEENPLIKDLRNIPYIFTTDAFWPRSAIFGQAYMCYRPIPAVSYAFDYSLWRLDPFWYHLENILLHSVNSVLVFLLFYAIFSGYYLAFLTALIFCIHPIHAEAVNFISGRADILQGLFTLLTMLFYFRYAATKRQFLFVLSLLSFALALITREAGFLFTIPFFILYAGRKNGVERFSLASHFFAFSALILIYVWLRLSVLVPVEMVPQSELPFGLDLLNLANIILRYLYLLIFPGGMYMLRTVPAITSFFSWGAVLPAVFVAALSAVFIWAAVTRRKIAVFGILWFISGVCYLLAFMHKFSGLVSMEEHWVYLPCLGIILIAVRLMLKLRPRKLCITVISGVLIFYAVTANLNSWNWSDQLVFYRRQIRLVDPGITYIIKNGLLRALIKSGEREQALKMAQEMVVFYRSDQSYVTLGNLLKDMGRYEEARQAYDAALKMDYFCLGANLGLRALSEKTGRNYEDDFIRKLPPQEAGIVRAIKYGRFNEARVALEKLLDSSPSPRYYTLAGIALAKAGSYRSAIGCFREAIKMDPDHLQAWYNLGVAYEKIRDYGNSEEAFRQFRNRKDK